MVASVLIVEGDDAARLLMAEVLERNDFTVAEAPTLASAYEQLATDPDEFDVLLVNANLPDGNGFTFVAALRALRFDRPIIVTSRNSEQTSRAAACGASAWMQEPFSSQRLLETINSAVVSQPTHNRGATQSPASGQHLIC